MKIAPWLQQSFTHATSLVMMKKDVHAHHRSCTAWNQWRPLSMLVVGQSPIFQRDDIVIPMCFTTPCTQWLVCLVYLSLMHAACDEPCRSKTGLSFGRVLTENLLRVVCLRNSTLCAAVLSYRVPPPYAHVGSPQPDSITTLFQWHSSQTRLHTQFYLFPELLEYWKTAPHEYLSGINCCWIGEGCPFFGKYEMLVFLHELDQKMGNSRMLHFDQRKFPAFKTT